MIEKVNPSHPDKIADRIAGAIVDLAYTKEENPKIAVEVLIGHGIATIIVESSVEITETPVKEIVERIAGKNIDVELILVPQDEHLAKNQSKEIRCGDNGIFKGVPLTGNEKEISVLARNIYEKWQSDGKYILTNDKFICCQSNAKNEDLKEYMGNTYFGKKVIINPLGEWTGGTDVDTGATNRKLGSDMAQSVTGGGLHGKDLSKADVSVNIYAFLKAQETGKVVELCCAIGDDTIDGKPYSEIVEIARKYIKDIGGFEKFAEWGLF
jgi:S-adenosylmethionine synthetase